MREQEHHVATVLLGPGIDGDIPAETYRPAELGDHRGPGRPVENSAEVGRAVMETSGSPPPSRNHQRLSHAATDLRVRTVTRVVTRYNAVQFLAVESEALGGGGDDPLATGIRGSWPANSPLRCSLRILVGEVGPGRGR